MMSNVSQPRRSPSRRTVLRAGAGLGIAGATVAVGRSAPASATPPTAAAVFAHGVASGDPLPDRVILWTRVTPSAAATPGSGAGTAIPVTWMIADDAALRRVVASGSVTTGPDSDFTVKVDPTGLSPDTVYHYGFAVTLPDGTRVASPVGTTRWRIVGNPVMISPVLIPPLDARNAAAVTELLGLPSTGVPYNADQWDGYPADRQRLLTTVRDRGIDNVVFITGDIPSSWACDIPNNAANFPAGGTVATELVGTSVTSSNIDDILKVPEHTVGNAVPPAIMAANNHVRWNDFDAHGYSVLTVTPAFAQMDWWFLNDKTDPRTGQYHARSFRVRDGLARVTPVAWPIT